MGASRLAVFKICGEEYGINMWDVLDIEKYKQPTKIPDAPEYIEGVIALGGDMVVVINLKKQITLGNHEIKDNSWIIVVDKQDIQIGAIVDEIPTVIGLDNYFLEQASGTMTDINSKYIKGTCKIEERIIKLLNLEYILEDIEL